MINRNLSKNLKNFDSNSLTFGINKNKLSKQYNMQDNKEIFNIDVSKMDNIERPIFNKGLISSLDSIYEEDEVGDIDLYLPLTFDNISKIRNLKENIKNLENDNISIKSSKSKISIKSQCGSKDSDDYDISKHERKNNLKASLITVDLKSDCYSDSNQSTHNGSDFEKISLSDRTFNNTTPDSYDSCDNLKVKYTKIPICKEKMNLIDIGIVNSTIGIFRRFIT